MVMSVCLFLWDREKDKDRDKGKLCPDLEVLIMICCTSLQVREGLASRVRAMMAAAIGALALVPEADTYTYN